MSISTESIDYIFSLKCNSVSGETVPLTYILSSSPTSLFENYRLQPGGMSCVTPLSCAVFFFLCLHFWQRIIYDNQQCDSIWRPDNTHGSRVIGDDLLPLPISLSLFQSLSVGLLRNMFR
jgi:hypothetical protein